MELVLKGFDNYVLNAASNGWVDLWKKDGEKWQLLDTFMDIGHALEVLLREHLRMTDDDVIKIQKEVPA